MHTYSPLNLSIFTISVALFALRKWRLTEAAALASYLTLFANIVLRIIRSWPNLNHKHYDLIPVVLGTLPLVLGIHGLELLGWQRQAQAA